MDSTLFWTFSGILGLGSLISAVEIYFRGIFDPKSRKLIIMVIAAPVLFVVHYNGGLNDAINFGFLNSYYAAAIVILAVSTVSIMNCIRERKEE